MLRCTPFLLFDGNCAAAMSFYHACVGGSLVPTKLGDTPMKAHFPPEKHERIINAQVKSGPVGISATDWMAAPAIEPKLGNMSAIFVIGTDVDELKAVFDKLAIGADKQHFQELHQIHLPRTGSFTTSMACSGSSGARMAPPLVADKILPSSNINPV